MALKIKFITLAMFLFGICASAQNSDTSVIHLDKSEQIIKDTSVRKVFQSLYVRSSLTKDGLMIRWAPNNKAMWLDGIDHGYILERYVQGSTDSTPGTFVPVANSPIRPWPLEQWRSIVSDDKPYCAAAAQCIYAKEEDSPKGFAERNDHEENLFGFNLLSADLDRDAAIASGLGYMVKDVDTNYFGTYRIRLAQPVLSKYVDTTMHYAFGRKAIFSPVEIDTIVQSENAVMVQWFSGNSGNKPTAYYIERSEDNKTFIRLNKQPYLDIKTNMNQLIDLVKYTDSLEENYKPYYYRVIGINSFAQESEPSVSVKAMGADVTPPNTPLNVTSQETKDGIVVINWDWSDLNKDNDLQGFYVEKSNSSKGPFTRMNNEILPPKTNKFLDNNPDDVSTNYYKVIAIDDKGNTSESALSFAITEDKNPPAAPTGLEGEIDSSGMLLLTWEPPADKDVRGYLVHFSNGKDANYAVIPGPYLTQPFYIDSLSLNTLTESIYYYVVALDLSYNPSVASEIVEVKKPDIVPPTASFFKNYKVEMGAINIEWVKSKSTDVEKVELWRRSTDTEWELVNGFDDSKKMYSDKAVEEGAFYEYTLKTYDDAGNIALPQKNLSLKARKSFFIDPVSKAALEKQKDSSVLTWSYGNMDGNTFIILKGEDKENLKTVAYVKGEKTYTDFQYTKKKDKVYAIKAKSIDGRTSKLVYIY